MSHFPLSNRSSLLVAALIAVSAACAPDAAAPEKERRFVAGKSEKAPSPPAHKAKPSLSGSESDETKKPSSAQPETGPEAPEGSDPAPAQSATPATKPQAPAAEPDKPAGVPPTPKQSTDADGAFEAVAISGDLTLKRMVLARDVVSREPVDPIGDSDTFAVGAKAHLFFELANTGEESELLSVRWEGLDGRYRPRPTSITVPVGKRYRSRAYTRPLRRAGEYQVALLGQDGAVVSAVSFRVVDDDSSQ